MDLPPIDVLTGRVDALERENRLWRRGGGLVLVAALVAVVAGARNADDARVIEAERIVIRDKAGKERISLGQDSNGSPAIWLRNKDGKPRAALYAGEVDESGSLALFGADGEREEETITLDGGIRTINSPRITLKRGDRRMINLEIDAGLPRQPWLRMSDQGRVLFQAP